MPGLGQNRCMTALPPKADVHPPSCYVAQVPRSDICSAVNCGLFDHLVGSQEDSRWQGNAQVFRRLLIDHKLKLRWQFGWDFSGFGPAQQLGDERRPLPMGAHWINAIGHVRRLEQTPETARPLASEVQGSVP